MKIYAEIILNTEALDIDRPFTYLVPWELTMGIRVGQIVKVPFGARNRSIEGIVLSIKKESEVIIDFKIKNIISIITKEPVITEKDVILINFLRDKYLCKYIDACRLLIPVGIMKGARNKSKSTIVFKSEDLSRMKNPEGYREIVELVKNNSGKYTKSELINHFSISAYKLNKLIESRLFEVGEEVVYRFNTKVYSVDSKKKLTVEQEKAIEIINNSIEKIFLVKGVTGSGKTEVYMRLVEDVLKNGKSAIILVPEISLTPQMVERFKGRFGSDVALFHSKLSDGERFDEWYRVKDGKVRLIVGARSAIFLPAKNLGIIIIDEEHENTYKSDQNPKYQTREVAEFISELHNCKVVLGSATPAIESYYRALSGEIKLIELKNRIDNRPMPVMEIVDMREELKNSNKSLFSRALFDNINNTLNKGQQVILFLNRRGFSTFVSCRSCGYVFECEDCDISMTYHRNGSLVCHYCGKIRKESKICPKCKSKYVKFFGAGTERVEEEVKKYFSKARVVRMDVDTTRTKNSHEKLYNLFKNGEGDILIGTQMISKGLDFPNVTLVGVLAADMSINIPDYRSAERSFQLITQVGGRAGRGTKEGKVIIQTYEPEHYSLKYAANYDYEGFYEKEFTIRGLMKYPPFGKILLISGASRNETLLINFMKDIAKSIKGIIIKKNGLELLGPVPCIISKIRENYRWQIIIKGEFSVEFAKNIKELLYDSSKNVYNEIRISMDINPNNLI